MQVLHRRVTKSKPRCRAVDFLRASRNSFYIPLDFRIGVRLREEEKRSARGTLEGSVDYIFNSNQLVIVHQRINTVRSMQCSTESGD